MPMCKAILPVSFLLAASALAADRPSSCARAPIEASLRFEPTADGKVRVTLQISEHGGLAVPLFIKASPPAGVGVEGALAVELAASSEPIERTVSWVVGAQGTVPAGDFAVTLVAKGEAWGFSFKDAYRFGRRAPMPRHIERAAVAGDLSEASLSSPVRMRQPAHPSP